MADSDDDTATLTEEEYAALIIRLVLGILYLSHPLLMWTIFGLDGAAHYFASVALPPSTAYMLAAADLTGGMMLLLGLYTRQVAIGLFPVAIAAAMVHFATGIGANLDYVAYLVGCLAGQALLASGALTPSRAAGRDDSRTRAPSW